jgi:hypothetical protein
LEELRSEVQLLQGEELNQLKEWKDKIHMFKEIAKTYKD